MKKRKISFVYRLVIILSLTTGLILNFRTTNSIQFLISYYTMQSNIICLFAFSAFEIAQLKGDKYKKSELYYAIKGMITIAIVVTGIVYLMALVPNNMPMYNIYHSQLKEKIIGNALVHVISPILVTLDYFLFDEKGNFKNFYPFIWLFFPLHYIIYVFLYRARGGRFYAMGGSREFGYFFLDYRQMGIIGVIACIVCIAIGIVLLGFIWVWIDKLLKQKKNKKKNKKTSKV